MKRFFKVLVVKKVEIKCKYHYIILDLVLSVYIRKRGIIKDFLYHILFIVRIG